MKREFVCSLIAFTNIENGVRYHNCLTLIIADNIDEANGIAMMLAKEEFPSTLYHSHGHIVDEVNELRIQLKNDS